eukprot:151938-Prorocentrum_minimum.AAC.3
MNPLGQSAQAEPQRVSMVSTCFRSFAVSLRNPRDVVYKRFANRFALFGWPPNFTCVESVSTSSLFHEQTFSHGSSPVARIRFWWRC